MFKIILIIVFVFFSVCVSKAQADGPVQSQIQDVQTALSRNSVEGIRRVINLVSDDSKDYNLRAYAAYALQSHFQLRDEIFEWAKPKTILVLDDFVLFFREREDSDLIRWVESVNAGEETNLTPMVLYHEQTHSHYLVINSNHIVDGKNSILDLKLANIIEIFEDHPVVKVLKNSGIDLHETISIRRKENGNFFVIYGFNDSNMNRRIFALIYPDIIIEDSPLSERMKRLQLLGREQQK